MLTWTPRRLRFGPPFCATVVFSSKMSGATKLNPRNSSCAVADGGTPGESAEKNQYTIASV